MSRQNYYTQRRMRKERVVDEALVVKLVQRERRHHPRMGGRKLHFLLKGELVAYGIAIGRDRFFDVLRKHDLLVPPLPRSARTTDSRHSLPVFRNLIHDVETTMPNQVWVCDITYVRIVGGFVYLSLIMDRYSRKIVGYHCGDSLEATGCLKALQSALADLPEGCTPIHHSDRGCQYCCHEYVDCLYDHGLAVSMTEENHCYENAHAERVNGILKQEYGLGRTFSSLEQARSVVDQAVYFYNERRPHSSLDMQCPGQVHRQAA